MDAVVIDLVALGSAARPLADWWDRFCATGEADVATLDAARKQLAGLCELPGRVGQAIRLIVRGPVDVAPVALTMAVELVANAARRCPTGAPASARPGAARRRRQRTPRLERGPSQLALPGFDQRTVDEASPVPPPA